MALREILENKTKFITNDSLENYIPILEIGSSDGKFTLFDSYLDMTREEIQSQLNGFVERFNKTHRELKYILSVYTGTNWYRVYATRQRE